MSKYLRKRSTITIGKDSPVPESRELTSPIEVAYVRVTYTVDLHSVKASRIALARARVWEEIESVAAGLFVKLTRLDIDPQEWVDVPKGKIPVPEMVPVSMSGPMECVSALLDSLRGDGYPAEQIAPQSRGKDGGWVSHAECSVPRVGAGLTPKLARRIVPSPKADCGHIRADTTLEPSDIRPLTILPGNPPRPAKWYGADATVREVEQLVRDVSRIGVVTTGVLPPQTDTLVSVPAPPAVLFRTQNVLSGVPDVLSPGQFNFLYDLLYLAHYAS